MKILSSSVDRSLAILVNEDSVFLVVTIDLL